jgi:hypothetical protein
MKFSTTAFAGLVAFITTVSADVSSTSCQVSHNSGNGGNQFSIDWIGLPSQAMDNICDSFTNDVITGVGNNGMQLKGSVLCETNIAGSGTIFTQLTINKQPCANELAVIAGAMSNAVGGLAPGTAVDSPVCNLSEC